VSTKTKIKTEKNVGGAQCLWLFNSIHGSKISSFRPNHLPSGGYDRGKCATFSVALLSSLKFLSNKEPLEANLCKIFSYSLSSNWWNQFYIYIYIYPFSFSPFKINGRNHRKGCELSWVLIDNYFWVLGK